VNAPRNEGRCPCDELVIGWALHALEAHEDGLVNAHLPGCAACQETASSTQRLGALLGTSVPLEEPPPGLRDRLMAAVERIPQVTPTEPAAPVVALESRGRVWCGLLVAAAVLLVVVSGIAVVLGVRLGQVASRERIQEAEQARMVGILTDPSMRRVQLSSGTGEQLAVLLSGGGQAELVPAGLTPNDMANQTYVLWGLTNGKPEPLAVFDVSSAGAGPESLHWSASAAAHAGFAVSLEPGRTMPDTPTKVVASGHS